jgi:hypothetical protein
VIAVRLHSPVREAETAQQLDAPDLEPDEKIRVVDHSHLVSFGVADPYQSVVDHCVGAILCFQQLSFAGFLKTAELL